MISGKKQNVHQKLSFELMNYFCGMIDRRKLLSLSPAGTIVRYSHHWKSPKRGEQDLNSG